MKIVYCIFVVVLQLPLKLHCAENNVCETFQDYYTIKKNKNCEYNIAADPASDPTTVIEFYGYRAETHKVTTVDGYELTIFRIPNNELNMKKGPVFLQHGLMSSAATFLGLGKKSLPFVLADAGYDVWLGNYRGTIYSEGHVNLTVFDEQYWDYSLDEIGLYDIPTQLEYVFRNTGNEEKITYIGHSLGTTVSLVYTSTYPEQAKRIVKLLILLGPAAQSSNIKAPIFKYLGPFFKPLLKLIKDYHLIRFVSQGRPLRSLSRFICLKSPLYLQGCDIALKCGAFGPRGQVDPKTLPIALNQVPAGSSFKILAHTADGIVGNFRRYDYGIDNFKIYGSYEPPPYDLTKIETPVFLVSAIGDWTTTIEDTRILYNNLSPKARHGTYEIQVPNFNHGDFVYGRNAKSLVYDVVLQVLYGMK